MSMKNLLAQKEAELHAIKPDAEGNFTKAQTARVDSLIDEITELRQHVQKADDTAALLARLRGGGSHDAEPIGTRDESFAEKAATSERKGRQWATKTLTRVVEASAGLGLKSLFSGSLSVDDPVITNYSHKPETATRLLDLIPVEGRDNGSKVSFLRQTVKTNNAAPVAMGALKPTSVYSFDDTEYPFETIAHISEPLNNAWASDYPKLIQIVGEDMNEGVIKALENQILNGNGTSPQLMGLMNTTGVTQVAYATDVLTTLARAYTVLTSKGAAPTGYVLNPVDAEALILLRENNDGAGQFLDFQRVFRAPVVESWAVPSGTALLADWRATQLTVREDLSTLVFMQHADLAAKNQFIIRAEGRYEFHIERPQDVAVVDLTA